MAININHEPPTNIPQLRRKYTIGSLFSLGLTICAIIIGAFSIFSDTGNTDILENTALILFVVSGVGFSYFTEKFLGFRRPGPKRQEKLVTMMYDHVEVAEYCRKVAEQGRYLLVVEYDAIVAYVEKIEEGKPVNKTRK